MLASVGAAPAALAPSAASLRAPAPRAAAAAAARAPAAALSARVALAPAHVAAARAPAAARRALRTVPEAARADMYGSAEVAEGMYVDLCPGFAFFKARACCAPAAASAPRCAPSWRRLNGKRVSRATNPSEEKAQVRWLLRMCA
jgi:hypothetical protein